MPHLPLAPSPVPREGFHLLAFNAKSQMIASVPLDLVTSNRRGVWLASGSAACSNEGRPVKVSVAFGGYVIWSGPARKKYIDWYPLGNEAAPPRMSIIVKEWPVRLEAAFQ